MVAFQPGNRSSGSPAAWAVDQIGTMLSPCSPRIKAVTCVGGRSIPSAIRLRNRAVSSTVPSPMTWLDGRSSCRAARYVSTSTGLETTRTIASRFEPGRGDLAEDVQEQLDIAVDQVEAALVGLAPQAGGDHDGVALGDRLVPRGADPLIGDERGPVEQVEGLPLDLVGVEVDQVDLADDAAALEREGRGRAHQAAAADDADFHESCLLSGSGRLYLAAPFRACMTWSVIARTRASESTPPLDAWPLLEGWTPSGRSGRRRGLHPRSGEATA